MNYLNRQQAPFGEAVWKMIDDAAVGAARDRLTARRFLDIDGPYGPGLTTIEVGNDGYCRQPASDEAGSVIGRAISVPMIRKSFRLSIRRLAGYLENGMPFDLAPAEEAAEAVAAREEETIYQGQPDFGLEGLLTAKGRNHVDGGNWSDLDQVLTDVIAAVGKLDECGLRGPYALALSPTLYNGLFRRYPGTDLLQLEHLRRLFLRGIHKASIEGGVIVDPRVGPFIVGQDMQAGYIGQDGIHYDLYFSESVVLRLDDAQAICTIMPKSENPA
ncbi:MAG: bacteriocin family protein [Rhodospirillales bacterium]|nr:bacteriocin family protein [Rhodospirillales bacterium]